MRVGGIILCGGESTRMGRPKMSLPFGAETMLERATRMIGSVVEPVVVVASPSQELPDFHENVIIARDEVPQLGPLGGLAVGLSRLRSHVEAAYVSGCDVPLLKPEFVRHLIERIGSHELVILRDGKYHHPLAAVYRTNLEDRVRELIAENRLRPFFLIESVNSLIIDVDEMRTVDPNLDSLRNVNTPEDYAAALRDAGFDDSTMDKNQ